MRKRSIYQDRLGTNIGKLCCGKKRRFLQEHERRGSRVDFEQRGSELPESWPGLRGGVAALAFHGEQQPRDARLLNFPRRLDLRERTNEYIHQNVLKSFFACLLRLLVPSTVSSNSVARWLLRVVRLFSQQPQAPHASPQQAAISAPTRQTCNLSPGRNSTSLPRG
jgi:hypothetical protein